MKLIYKGEIEEIEEFWGKYHVRVTMDKHVGKKILKEIYFKRAFLGDEIVWKWHHTKSRDWNKVEQAQTRSLIKYIWRDL